MAYSQIPPLHGVDLSLQELVTRAEDIKQLEQLKKHIQDSDMYKNSRRELDVDANKALEHARDDSKKEATHEEVDKGQVLHWVVTVIDRDLNILKESTWEKGIRERLLDGLFNEQQEHLKHYRELRKEWDNQARDTFERLHNLDASALEIEPDTKNSNRI